MLRPNPQGALALVVGLVAAGAFALFYESPALAPASPETLSAASGESPPSRAVQPGPDAQLTPVSVPSAADVRRQAGREARAAARRAQEARVAAEREARERLRALEQRIEWKTSTAVGTATRGRLVDGVKLPHEGLHFFTWDPVAWEVGNPADRRYGTDHLIRTVLKVTREHRAANPGAPRVAVGDLSRPQGGSFDASHGVLGEFNGRGTLGHVSHQNGLDVDIYYPRKDGRERGPASVDQIDLALAQDLVDRFVAEGAEFVFIGPNTPLTGPANVVQALPRHDDHIHVRLRAG